MKGRVFIDSNIWLYAKLDGQDPGKSARARACLLEPDELVISSQIALEVGHNLLKKRQASRGPSLSPFVGPIGCL